MKSSVRSVVVIGGGLNGLAALFHLCRFGCSEPLLLERFQVGHDRGSSHGPSRIARSTYAKTSYVRMMRAALAEEWPRLERAAGEPLLFKTPGLFFGPADGPIGSYALAVEQAGAEVDRLSVHEARARFPLLRFDGASEVLFDRTAAVIASARTLRALERTAVASGGEIQTGVEVLEIDVNADPIRIATDRGEILTERAVIAAGPWTSRIVPSLEPRLAVMRQSVAYFELEGPRDAYRVGRFPIWAWMGAGENAFYYGLPEFDHPGIKIARHVTRDRNDDPDAQPGGFEEDAIEDLRAIALRELYPAVRGLAGADTCLYTSTATEDFILDLHPDNPRIAIGAGFSGHGFKFGPLTGRILAELCLYGDCKLPEFQALRSEFAWSSAAAVR